MVKSISLRRNFYNGSKKTPSKGGFNLSVLMFLVLKKGGVKYSYIFINEMLYAC